VWLGFEPKELAKMARAAGFERADVVPIASPFVGVRGPDAHLPWQVLVARAPSSPSPSSNAGIARKTKR
jgi:hypothetical protein